VSGVALPEAMEVAVFIGGDGRISVRQGEDGLRPTAGGERLALAALPRLQQYPLDVMLFLHGVLDGAHRHGDEVPLDPYDGDVLFARAVRGVRDERLHLLAAADAADARVFYVRDDVPAVLAVIKCHGGTSLCMFFIMSGLTYYLHYTTLFPYGQQGGRTAGFPSLFI